LEVSSTRRRPNRRQTKGLKCDRPRKRWPGGISLDAGGLVLYSGKQISFDVASREIAARQRSIRSEAGLSEPKDPQCMSPQRPDPRSHVQNPERHNPTAAIGILAFTPSPACRGVVICAKQSQFGRAPTSPANPNSEARNPKEIPNANVPNGGRQARPRQTNPISCVFGAKTRGGVKNKANRRGRGPRLGIGDCRLGIRGRDMRRARADSAANKANPGRGGLGIDDGLWIIDDLG
jgi:hypothetical protein